VPLEHVRGALRSPTNWESPEFEPLCEDEEAAAELAEAVVRRRTRSIRLAFVPAGSRGLVAAAAAARSAGYRLLERVLERSPYIDTAGGLEAYDRRLDGKLRRDLGRRRRLLDAEGEVTLDVTDGSERLDELVGEALAIEAAGWKGERGSAILARPAAAEFFRLVSRWAAERAILRLAFLRVGGRAIAFDLCFEEGGVHYLLKTSYDPAWRRFAPGKLLRHEMIRRAFAEGVSSYEFLGSDEPWKYEWTQDVRVRTLFQAFRPSLPGLVEWSAWAYGRPLVKRALALVR
jgi:CelD/BcsL family acetyltransferase involved in cellulose biosynthesis